MASVKRREDGKWRARYRDARGKEHSKHFARKVDAQLWLDGVTVAVQTGSYVNPAMSRVTVGEWSARWLEGQGHLKPSTRARYEGILRVQVLPTWGLVRLSDVTHADVVAWVTRLTAGGLAPSSVRQVHRVFSMVLGLAVRDGRMPRNPADKTPLPRAATPEKRFLTHGEVANLADAAGSYGLAIRVLAYTGLRFGELAALRVRRLDLMRRRIEVAESVTEVGGRAVWGTPKSHAARSVPVGRSLVDALALATAGKGPDDFVFSAPRGGALMLQNFRRSVFDPAVRAAGLEDVTPHDLRHTAASLAVSAGANVKAVQRLLGHASAAMTLDVYSGLFDDDLDAVADRLDEGSARAAADQVRTTAAVVGIRQTPASR
jgi:integrase